MFTILFPTDFSQPAAHALEYAVSLAEKIGGKLLLLHAVPIPLQDPNTFFKASEVYSKDEAKVKLEGLQRQVAARVPCEAVLKVGYSVTEATDLMKQSTVDLVVIGTRGAGSTPDPLVGSTTAVLIEKSPRPVLVIPAAAAFVAPQRIVLAADLRETNRTTLEPLVAFSRLLRAEVLVVNVATREGRLPEEKSVAALQLEDYLGEVPSSLHVVVHDDVAEGIENFVLEKRAQLLVLVARKHGFFASLFHDSVTRKMALHAQVPLLALTEGE
jgi:nucleotide-binding universal stress UspA family protein